MVLLKKKDHNSKIVVAQVNRPQSFSSFLFYKRNTQSIHSNNSQRRSQDNIDCIEQAKNLVNQLINNEGNQNQYKVTINPNCIPKFNPSVTTLSCSKWLDKIDQLGEINKWDDNLKIFHMQACL